MVTSACLTSATCSPTLNGLQVLSGLENGPFRVPGIPSGYNGRERKPTDRLVNANFPSSPTPSAAAASANAANAPELAVRNCAPAVGRLKNAAVRAFCALTSNPKIGASRVLNIPSTAPLVSTTVMLTSAGEPS